MNLKGKLWLSHVGFYVTDINKMVDFYTRFLGFTVSDRGPRPDGEIVFMTRDASEHHQLVFASGRPAELSFNVINQISFRLDGLATLLPELGTPPQTRVVSNVRGIQGVLERAIDVIEGARSSLFVSVWPAEAAALRPALERAAERGVDVSIIVFGGFDPPVGRVYHHRYSSPDVVLARLGRKIFTVVADHAAVVIAGIDGGDVWGVWSDDSAVALVAAEYVRHDIALQLIAERIHDHGMDDFWQTDPELERLRTASGLGPTLHF